MKRDNYACVCVAAGFAAALAVAAPEVRTFPVTVSNRVSGLLETVPLTFRFGETNGIIERLDGAQFRRVPIAAHDFSGRESLFAKTLHVSPEKKLHRRLLEVLLPPQQFGPTNLVGLLDQLALTIRRRDSSNASPVRVKSRLTEDCLGSLPAVTIPATNAWDAIRAIAAEAGKVMTRAHAQDGSGASLPVAVYIHGGDEVSLWYDDDTAITQSYSVPNSFWRRYPRDSLFHRDVRQKLGIEEWGKVHSVSRHGVMRVTCYSKKWMARFEEEVYEPLLEELLKPLTWEPVLCEAGSRSQLFLKGTTKGTFCGLWLYRADRIGNAIENDRLDVCLVENGFVADQVSGPRTYAFDSARAGLGDAAAAARETGAFVLYTHDGTVARLEGTTVILVKREDVPDPQLHRARANSSAAPSALALLSQVIVPELTVHDGESITGGVAQIQAAVRMAGAPTNRVMIGVDVARILAQIPHVAAVAMLDGDSTFIPDPFSQSGESFGAVTNMSALGTRFVSACDAVKLLADVTGLTAMGTGPMSVELVTYLTYTQRMTRVQTYTLPKPLCAHIPDARWWVETFEWDRVPGCRVASYVPETGELKVEAAHGDFTAFENYLAESVYMQFPGRFKLENKRVDGCEELVLTDTYRDVSARYRRDGSRAESFEVMK